MDREVERTANNGRRANRGRESDTSEENGLFECMSMAEKIVCIGS